MAELRVRFKEPFVSFLQDPCPEIDIEGGLSAGKTTACLWKVWQSLERNPGIHWFIGRFGDEDTSTKLCPAFEAICQAAGWTLKWHPDENYYEVPNGGRVYAHGLKSPDHTRRYSKLRGLGVAGAYVDQTEEMPPDFSGELRARLRQPNYPHQLLFSPNPMNVNSWLAEEFPEDNHVSGRKLYQVSLYDNQHNLPKSLIEGLERSYPQGHAKHRSVILGRRGMNVTGEPVYKGLFDRARHIRPLVYNPDLPLVEAVDFGQHHPCWVAGQFTPYGGIHFLAGIQGQDLFLDEFLPIVQQHRAQWFPRPPEILTCCDPAGSHANSQGTRENGVTLLKRAGFDAVWVPNSNAPDVRNATIERLGAYMTRRTVEGESLGISDDPTRWLLVARARISSWPMVAEAFEAGYVWDVHTVSVSNKPQRKAKKDGWFEHGMNCCEYLELNFGRSHQSQAQEQEATARARAAAESQVSPMPTDPHLAALGWMN
jgi:hypothetical protein